MRSLPSLLRKVRRIMLALFVAIGVVLLVVLGLLLVYSCPGKPRPFLEANGVPIPGSLSEKIRVRIGGVEQGMILKARDSKKPVLLYLHGGMPDYFLTERNPTGLDDLFTVCWWEQRGAGLSFSPDIPKESINVNQLVSDALEVTDYLRQRFGQDRIYLMGHSGGTFLAMHLLARAPEKFHAYIGVAQMGYQLESERIAYDYMLKQFKERGDAAMVKKMEAAPVTEGGISAEYFAIRDVAMHSLGVGTMRRMRSVGKDLFLESLKNREYTLGEKINTWRGKATTGVSSMWKEMLVTDLKKQVAEVHVPVYILHGVHDYTCCYSEAASYFQTLRAPKKGFYRFTESAHSPIFEEPEKVQRIVREDVLNGTTALADMQ